MKRILLDKMSLVRAANLQTVKIKTSLKLLTTITNHKSISKIKIVNLL
jgi:hypothetical protein